VTQDDFRRRAAAVRSIPLQTVLAAWGAQPDRSDRAGWRTQRGPLSVTGAKFFNWHRNEGGGGAIDLVMHLGEMDYPAAVAWLEQQLGSVAALSTAASSSNLAAPRSACVHAKPKGRPLRLPVANPANLQRVRRYLIEQRCLSANILEPLMEAGKVYADGRGNAVFLMVAGRPNRAVGAELRGTGKRVWRGLAPGSCKDEGYFWIGERSAKQRSTEKIVLCESAIDAISCFQLHAGQTDWPCISISTAGVRPDASWLQPLMTRGYDIYCGFDDDEPGNAASHQMIGRHPSIERLCPPAHDWNDALVSR
jgi:hypothetical protein